LHCLEVYGNRKRRFDNNIKEVVLEEFNITLNIKDANFNLESIRIDPRNLFSQYVFVGWQVMNSRVPGHGIRIVLYAL
jgi:hypothetical protein